MHRGMQKGEGWLQLATIALVGANVRLIDHKVLSSIYPAMNSSFFSSVMVVFDKGQPLVYTFIPSFIPNMILLKGFYIHVTL